MSPARSVLARAEAAGLKLSVEGEGLRLRGSARPPADLLADIQAAKPALLRLLSAGDHADVEIPAAPCPTCGQSAWWQRRAGEPWRCDVCDPHPDGWPSARPVIDLDERRAIQSEPSLPPIGTAARDLADAKQAAMLAGLLASSLRRPPSWWNELPQIPPSGSVCSCCGRRDWWTRDRRGWCCAVCHPPVGEQFPERLIRAAT